MQEALFTGISVFSYISHFPFTVTPNKKIPPKQDSLILFSFPASPIANS
jgi:hypothetical protein